MTNEDLVRAYVKIRATIEKRETEFKDKIKTLKDQLKIVSDEILTVCNDAELDGFKTSGGTVTRTITERFWPSDWEAMYKFITDNNAPFLLHKKIHNKNMSEFLEDNPTLVPEGLQTDRVYSIKVRKPTAK